MYPKIDFPCAADHLLFDIGYSYGLLRRCEAVLALYSFGDPEVKELLAELASLRAGRIQLVDEIYAAAAEAAAKSKQKN